MRVQWLQFRDSPNFFLRLEPLFELFERGNVGVGPQTQSQQSRWRRPPKFNSCPVIRCHQVAIRLGQGRSAVELIDGVTMPRNGSSTGHGRKEQEPTVKKEIQKAIRHYGKTVQENITCELLRAGMQEAFPSGGVSGSMPIRTRLKQEGKSEVAYGEPLNGGVSQKAL
jgi:hypothetical protein